MSPTGSCFPYKLCVYILAHIVKAIFCLENLDHTVPSSTLSTMPDWYAWFHVREARENTEKTIKTFFERQHVVFSLMFDRSWKHW